MEQGAKGFDALFVQQNPVQKFETGYRWEMSLPELNDSARALCTLVDELLRVLDCPDHVCLIGIELDVDAGRFPAVLTQYFRDIDSADERTFFVAPIRHLQGDGHPTGRLVFAAKPGELRTVLSFDAGFRWGAALRVWGLQIGSGSVGDALERDPYAASDRERIGACVRAAWRAGDDLDVLGLWLSNGVSDVERQRLSDLGPSHRPAAGSW
jgi:hypothetical protein